VTFPVKVNWWEKANIKLIERSCIEIASLPCSDTFVMPRVGCGFGGLSWHQVEPILEKLLDDRFIVLI